MSENETKVEDARCQFPLRRAIDEVLDDLIAAGADKVSLLQGHDVSRSQIKNVVNVAAGTRSRNVVGNFIRYQMGRKVEPWLRRPKEGQEPRARGGQPGSGQLQPPKERKVFGREVIADLEGEAGQQGRIDKAVDKVCARVQAELTKDGWTVDQEKLRQEARVRLTTLYLGYLNRTFAYCKGAESDLGQEVWNDVKTIAGLREDQE
jgi:hypothetical protein